MTWTEPRLRTAEKVPPPYQLNKFPADFALNVGKQVIYILATKPTPQIRGGEWEEIFAKAIGAKWKPSNIGLDDIVLGNCAWGAKTLRNNNPWECSNVRLISGRNSPVFSYGETISTDHDPKEVGRQVVEIWNARIESIRAKHKHVRTVVLVKSKDLLKLSIFEFETVRYSSELYNWIWNERGNLEGYRDDVHYFTWQPHGSQFTIKEYPPKERLRIELKKPAKMSQNDVFKAIGFKESWVKVL